MLLGTEENMTADKEEALAHQSELNFIQLGETSKKSTSGGRNLSKSFRIIVSKKLETFYF